MKTGKIILMILIVIVCICLLFHGCCYMIFNAFFNALVESDMSISEEERAQAHRPKEVFGLTTSDYRIIDERDTHQGWLGDGEYYLILDCSQNAERACSIVREWKPLPLSQNLNRALYGEEKDGINSSYTFFSFAEEVQCPRIEHGFYRFLDRHSEAENPEDDTELFSRYSFNFSVAIYDTDSNILYYYESDT